MGACLSHSGGSCERVGVGLYGPPYEDPIPALHREITKDMKRVMGDSLVTRAKIGMRILGKADLQRAFDFVELQMLLPRRNCIDTQVLVLTAAQLACCGMLLQQPSLNSPGVQNVCLHVLFEMRPLQMEAHGIALANLARSLRGNKYLEKLNLNLMGITLVSTTPMARKIFAGVMQSFAAMLCMNTTLRLLRFEGMMGGGDEVPWSESDAEQVCKAQAAHRTSLRLAFLMGQHPRAHAASPLARKLPLDVLQRILDCAVPLRPLCKVEFDFFRDDTQLDELVLPIGI